MNKSQKFSTDLSKTIENFHAKLLWERRVHKTNRSEKTLRFISEYYKTYATKGSGIV